MFKVMNWRKSRRNIHLEVFTLYNLDTKPLVLLGSITVYKGHRTTSELKLLERKSRGHLFNKSSVLFNYEITSIFKIQIL